MVSINNTHLRWQYDPFSTKIFMKNFQFFHEKYFAWNSRFCQILSWLENLFNFDLISHKTFSWNGSKINRITNEFYQFTTITGNYHTTKERYTTSKRAACTYITENTLLYKKFGLSKEILKYFLLRVNVLAESGFNFANCCL